MMWYLLIILLSLGDKLSESAILRKFPNLEEYFIRERNNHYSSQSINDPFVSYTKEQRKAACQELLEARAYYMLPEVPGETGFPDFLTGDLPYDTMNIQALDLDESLLSRIGYNKLTIRLNQSQESIYAFICARIKDSNTVWYLTYGYNIADTIVLQTSHDNPRLPILLGVLEPTPYIDTQLYKNQHNLEVRFLERFLRRDDSNTGSEICSSQMDMFRQFFLCTSVYDAWFETSKSLQKREYYVKLRQNQCIKRNVKLTYDYSKIYRDNRNNDKVLVDMLPCAIQREWNTPGFSIIPDPAQRFAVFIAHYTIQGYMIIAHVENIKLLMP